MPNPQPSSSDIGVRQNKETNIRRQLAARHYYDRGRWSFYGGVLVSVGLALASPFVLWFWPEWGPYLGAAGGFWTFFARAGINHLVRHFQKQGAIAQEMFDCEVLGIEWNEAMIQRLTEEEIRHASGDLNETEDYANWYPTQTIHAWPVSVLACQRANAVWAQRQHRHFGTILLTIAILWFVAGLVFALAYGTSLSTYLVVLLLPSLPAYLDAEDLARQHRTAASNRGRLQLQIDRLVARHQARPRQIREIQDQLFSLRRTAPQVPQWFYSIIRPSYEQDMHYASGLLVKESSQPSKAAISTDSAPLSEVPPKENRHEIS